MKIKSALDKGCLILRQPFITTYQSNKGLAFKVIYFLSLLFIGSAANNFCSLLADIHPIRIIIGGIPIG